MRFLKTLTLNRRAIYDDRVALDVNNTFTTATSTAMVLPKSSSSLSSVQTEGMIRYNTSTHQVEVYQGSGGGATWRSLRFKESTSITQQNLGAGDAAEVYFGPLNPAPPSVVQSGATWGGQNLLVIVENVLQLYGSNYLIEENPPVIGAEAHAGATSAAASTGASTLYFNTALSCTGGSAAAGTATLTFTTRSAAPFAVGSVIVVTGFRDSSSSKLEYNGTFVVTACTTSSVSFANNTTATLTEFGQVASSKAVYPSTNFSGAAVTSLDPAIDSGTTVSTYTTDADTKALVSITLSTPLIGNLAANTDTTVTESTVAGSGYYLKFSSPVPYGKIVTVLHGFDQ